MHLRYSPSGAKRWMKCPGSLNVVRSEGDNDTVYSNRGTILHTIAENCVRFDTDPAQHYTENINGYIVTKEDIDHILAYKRTIKRWSDLCGYTEPKLEEFVRHPDIEDFGGTIDCLIDSPTHLVIIDFKAGQGVYVDPVENPQLMSYMSCVRRENETREMWVVVVQPSSLIHDDSRKSWRVTNERLDRFEEDVRAAIAIDKSGTDLVVLDDGSHCQFCPRMGECPAIIEDVDDINQMIERGEAIEPERMSQLLTRKPVVNAFFRALEEKAIDILQEGTTLVPGYKLVEKQGRLAWTIEDAEVLEMLESHGYDTNELARKLPTPTQIKKLLGEDAIADISARPDRGVELAPEDSHKMGVDQASLRKVFGE